MGPKRQKTTNVVLCDTSEDSSSTHQHPAHTPAPPSLSHSSVTDEHQENSTPHLTAGHKQHSCPPTNLQERLQTTAQTEQLDAALTHIPTPQTTAQHPHTPSITHTPHPTAEPAEPPPSFPATQTSIATQYLDIERRLCGKLMSLPYGETVQYVYNPVDYAWEIHQDFVVKFCQGKKKVLLLGMNPGPWGMGQTGVSGDVCMY